jgi:hypothetical protein
VSTLIDDGERTAKHVNAFAVYHDFHDFFVMCAKEFKCIEQPSLLQMNYV